jgi:tripeptidyl-peptidase-1
MAPRALTLALAGLALCALAGHAYALQLRATKTNGWQAKRSAPADRVISITVGLRTRNLDALEQTLWAVSDPRSPDYGRFLSATQVRALIAPQEAVVARVEAWLRAAPALTLERGACGDVLLARLTVAAAERLVGARFSEFAHPERPLTASGEVRRARISRVLVESLTRPAALHNSAHHRAASAAGLCGGRRGLFGRRGQLPAAAAPSSEATRR